MRQYTPNGSLQKDKEPVMLTPLELEGGEKPEITEEKLEKKDTQGAKEEQEDEGDGKVTWKAYLGATGAAIGLGLADYLASLLGAIGIGAIFAEWFGCLIAWVGYHIYCYVEWQCTKESPDEQYFTLDKSMYYEVVPTDEGNLGSVAPSDQENGKGEGKKEYRFSRVKCCGMISRVVFQLGIQLSLLTTFYFGSRSGVNNGIISTIFSSGVIFTALIFWCVYGQKLTCYDILGSLGIILCVALISIGGAGSEGGHGPDLSADLTDEQKNYNLMLAIISATVTGLVFALNSLSIQFCSANGCGVSQANMDAMLVMFLILLPGFLSAELGRGDEPTVFTFKTMAIATAILMTQVFGIISLSIGLKYGTAGPVQAVENQKTTIQTLLEAAVQRNLPTIIQWGGLAAGIIGVTIIVCQPKKEAPKEEENKVEPEQAQETRTQQQANEVK